MYCNNCGKEIKEGDKFCNNCGKQFEGNSEGLGTASMILGIISLILMFIINILVLPISVTGLILGIVNKVKKGKKISGIIMNGISTVLSIVIFFVMMVVGVSLFTSVFRDLINSEEFKDGINEIKEELKDNLDDDYTKIENNPVEGDYNCKSFDGSGESASYLVRLELDDDYTVMWGKYGETSTNYVKGNYTYKDLEKKNNSGEYSYYNVTINGDIYVEDGVTQSKTSPQEYEFGITTKYGKKQGILMNTRTQNKYYCYED